MHSLMIGSVYEVVSGSFKGSMGILQAGLGGSVLFLKTGIDSRILVTGTQIKPVK